MFRSPRFTPPLSYMLEDIAKTDAEVAKWLGISVETLRRYKKAEQAPRAVMHALFFQTKWGLGQFDAEMHNSLMYANAEIAELRKRCKELEAIIQRLEAEIEANASTAANGPVFWKTSV